jgi:protein required for attachment to host cells
MRKSFRRALQRAACERLDATRSAVLHRGGRHGASAPGCGTQQPVDFLGRGGNEKRSPVVEGANERGKEASSPTARPRSIELARTRHSRGNRTKESAGGAMTWIVVAHRIGARILEIDDSKQLSLVEELEHPDGRLTDREIDTDKPGRAFSSAGAGGGHPMNREELASERVGRDFARRISECLFKARVANRVDRIVLVAEPRFLGYLREALDAATADCVIASVRKDLAAVPTRELAPYLADAIEVEAPQRLFRSRL